MPKMTVRVILKSGVEFSIKCDKFTLTRNGFQQVTSYNIEGITENQPVYLDFEQVAAVVRVFPTKRRWRTMNKALLSSKNMCWCTPQDFFDKLNAEFGFVLDPAATDKTAKCSLYYTPETDGLSQSWDRGGAVFCNPPYGREIGKWVQKAYKEARGGYPIVLLIPARTDTAYFHDYIYGKAEIRFVRRRLRFTDDDGNAADPAPFPSMVVIYNGERVKE